MPAITMTMAEAQLQDEVEGTGKGMELTSRSAPTANGGVVSDGNGSEASHNTKKRQSYLEWQEYFMSIAFLSAQRSKDPRTQVGACIVNQENKVVGIGYNGMPIGCKDDDMPWNRAEDSSEEKWLQSKSPYVCHAELNAVLNKNLADVRGCSIYVALFPCNLCAQIIIQSGIKEVIYYSDKYHDIKEFQASRHLMDMTNVSYRQFRPRQKRITIEFGLIEKTVSEVPTLPKQSSFTGLHSVPEGPDFSGAGTENGGPPNTATNDQPQVRQEEDKKPDISRSGGPATSAKRQGYLELQEYFMAMAFLSAQRSKDPRTQVGACIVNQENKVVGIGYNGMPIGCKDDDMPWNRAEDSSKEKWLLSKSPYVCHAVLNAVLNKNLADISGCSIYVALFPCNMCAQIIIQSGIKEVIYYSDKYHEKVEFQASRHLMKMAGVKHRQFRPRQKEIIIDFGLIERTESTNV